MSTIATIETRLTARDQTGTAFRSAGKSIDGFRDKASQARKALLGIGTVAIGLGTRSLIETNREFGKLQGVLRNILSPAESLNKKIKELQNISKTVPFTFKEVADSFTRLRSAGINPTMKQMETFSDHSAAMGKSLLQYSEALIDAQMGEFERFKEFGVRIKNEGKTLAVTFKGQTTSIVNDAKVLTEHLDKIAQHSFAGVAAAQMKELDGAFSNLSTAIERLEIDIGERGFSKALKDVINNLTEAIETNRTLARDIEQVLTPTVKISGKVLEVLAQNIQAVSVAVTAFLGLGLIKFVKWFTDIGKYSKIASTAISGLWVVLKQHPVARIVSVIGLAASAFGALNENTRESIKSALGFGEALEKNKITLDRNKQILGSVADSEGRLRLAFSETNKHIFERLDKSNFAVYADEIVQVADASGKSDEAIKKNVKSVEKLQKSYSDLINNLRPVTASNETFLKSLREINEAISTGALGSEYYAAAIKAARRESLGFSNESNEFSARQIKINRALHDGVISFKEYSNSIGDLKGDILDYEASVNRTFSSGAKKAIHDYFSDVKDFSKSGFTFVSNAFKSMEDTLAKFFRTGTLDFKSFVSSIWDGLSRLAAQGVMSVASGFFEGAGKVAGEKAGEWVSSFFASGGYVRGSGTSRSDSIPARLSNGEYVINADSVKKVGIPVLDLINSGSTRSDDLFKIFGRSQRTNEDRENLNYARQILSSVKASESRYKPKSKTRVTRDQIPTFRGAIPVATNLYDAAADFGVSKIQKKLTEQEQARIKKEKQIAKAVAKHRATQRYGFFTTLLNLVAGGMETVAQPFMPVIKSVGGTTKNLMEGVTEGNPTKALLGALGVAGTFFSLQTLAANPLQWFAGKLGGKLAGKAFDVASGASAVKSLDQHLNPKMQVDYVKAMQGNLKDVAYSAANVNVLSQLHAMMGAKADKGLPMTVGEQGRELFIPTQDGRVVPIEQKAVDLKSSLAEIAEHTMMNNVVLKRFLSQLPLFGSRSNMDGLFVQGY